MLDEAFSSKLLTEGKHWPADYIKTAVNAIKASPLGQQSWYSDAFIQQDANTFASEFEPLSHKSSNLGFFMPIIRWFIEYSGTSKQKYQEFIERKLDGIIAALLEIRATPSYDKMADKIKAMSFAEFEKLAEEAKKQNTGSSANLTVDRNAKYNVIPIYSYEELNEKYGGNKTGYKGQSEWCHSNGKSTYDSWTKNGTQMFFVIEREGWEKTKAPEPSTTNAYDEYGLSLIAILVDIASGKLLNETLRWNHIIGPSETNPGATVDRAFKNDWKSLNAAVGIDVKKDVSKLLANTQDKLRKKADEANRQAEEILKGTTAIIIATIPSSLKNYITKIDIPDNVTSIGDGAFYSCSSLTSITIPDSVSSIGYSAFYHCNSLISVKIPSSVTSIDNYVFYGCSSLKSVTIPDSVTSIGYGLFYGCSSLKSIQFAGKTLKQVKQMKNYPWGIEDTSKIKAQS